jgi:hypothetical protein
VWCVEAGTHPPTHPIMVMSQALGDRSLGRPMNFLSLGGSLWGVRAGRDGTCERGST